MKSAVKWIKTEKKHESVMNSLNTDVLLDWKLIKKMLLLFKFCFILHV